MDNGIDIIETNRCIISLLRQEDYKEARKLYRSEEVRRYLGGVIEEADIEQRFKQIVNSREQDYYWTVRAKNSNEFIGMVSLDRHHDRVSMELSYQILPNFWGQGYGEEVLRAIIKYAFEKLKLKKLVAETQSKNLSSCHLLEKLGFLVGQKLMRFGAEQCIYRLIRE